MMKKNNSSLYHILVIKRNVRDDFLSILLKPCFAAIYSYRAMSDMDIKIVVFS